MRVFTLLFLASTALIAQGQLDVNSQLTAEQLVQNIFQGFGVTISNVTINGMPGTTSMFSMGAYSYEGPLLPLEGIVLSSGGVDGVPGGSGFSGDPDLTQISGNNIYDQMILEFDFVPDEDTIIFEYVFASMEYSSFTCSAFNDVFGFFVSGPSISGPFSNNAINIALIPGTSTPVSINTVNSGIASTNGSEAICAVADPAWQSNNIYFVADTGSVLFMNGFTVILQATASVVAGQTSHIKLAIGDASDPVLESAVFLQASSFRSMASIPTSAARTREQTQLITWFADGSLVIDDARSIQCLWIRDAQGRLVMELPIRSNGRTSIPLDLRSGIYLVEALCGEDRAFSRVIHP